MDIKLKQTALKNLARTAGEVAEKALFSEVNKIEKVLQNEIQYDSLAEQLDLLGTIAFRVHVEVVKIVNNLILRLEHLDLTHQDVEGLPPERIREYETNESLVVKSLEVLERIRYHETEAVLQIFFTHSISPKPNIKKQALHGLEVLAGYDRQIFYSDGKEWKGLGWQPQEKVLEAVVAFDDQQKLRYFSGILTVCGQILSPTIEGNEWTYSALTMTTSAIPAFEEIKTIRRSALTVLVKLYSLTADLDQKTALLQTMGHATRTPNMGDYKDDTLQMIMQDTFVVLQFMNDVVRGEELELKQEMEHDAYFFYRRGTDDDVKSKALQLKEILDNDKEYQIFKVLIGFKGVFREWSEEDFTTGDFEKERSLREKEATEFAASIDDSNYAEWRARILRYSQVKSNDLATFPHFGKFLEHFGRLKPALALRFLLEAPDQFEQFNNAVLLGIAETEFREKAYGLIAEWCDKGKFISSSARFFEFSKQLDEGLLEKIFQKAVALNDLNAVNQVISSVAAQFTNEKKHLTRMFILPALEILTRTQNYNWIFGFWFRKEGEHIIANMTSQERQKVLDNLIWLKEIDYHAEYILVQIARVSADLVVRFFIDRIKVEEEGNIEKYDAIPFSFHELSAALSKIPDEAVDLALKSYDGNYGMFIYRGARLLKNIFPKFSKEFEKKLVEVTRTKEKNNLMFVMGVLRNFEGEPFIHEVGKALVKVLPADPSLLNELTIILLSTGIVTGSHGFVEAYERKREEIKPWFDDSDDLVRKFARNYDLELVKRIEFERKRADDDVTLRKHMYGVGKVDE